MDISSVMVNLGYCVFSVMILSILVFLIIVKALSTFNKHTNGKIISIFSVLFSIGVSTYSTYGVSALKLYLLLLLVSALVYFCFYTTNKKSLDEANGAEGTEGGIRE